MAVKRGGKKPERARVGAWQRTTPNAVKSISVNLTATQDLSNMGTPTDGDTTTGQDLRGLWIMLAATGADITVLDAATAVAPATAGVGFILKAGDAPQEFYFDPDGDVFIGARAATAATLLILWDSGQNGS